MKYRFMEDHRSEFGVEGMCRVLGVSRSGYYDWRGRGPSLREERHRRLLPEIERAFRASRQTYGSPRVFRVLRAEGPSCGRHQVERLMRQHGITPRRCRRFRQTTDSDHDYPPAPNLVARVFRAEALNRLWTADITYIPTAEGWLYLAVILDVCSRRIVGWGMGPGLLGDLVTGALNQALGGRPVEAGLVFHSDRGCQFAAESCRRLLQDHGIVSSMSRRGDCYDNAITESFFGKLKTELVHREDFQTREEAQTKIFDYIEAFYNRQRIHSSIGYQTPVAFEKTIKVP